MPHLWGKREASGRWPIGQNTQTDSRQRQWSVVSVRASEYHSCWRPENASRQFSSPAGCLRPVVLLDHLGVARFLKDAPPNRQLAAGGFLTGSWQAALIQFTSPPRGDRQWVQTSDRPLTKSGRPSVHPEFLHQWVSVISHLDTGTLLSEFVALLNAGYFSVTSSLGNSRNRLVL